MKKFLSMVLVLVLLMTGVFASQADAAYKGKTASKSSSKRVRKLMRIAGSKVGCRYVRGCEGPKRFDCSGYVYYCVKKAGRRIPRSSAKGLWRSVKSRSIGTTRLSRARKGDLVFFAPSGKISHVAIYCGNRKIIHAVNPRKGVRITPTRYFGRVAGIARMF